MLMGNWTDWSFAHITHLSKAFSFWYVHGLDCDADLVGAINFGASITNGGTNSKNNTVHVMNHKTPEQNINILYYPQKR